MAEKKYTSYSVEDLVHDQEFIALIKGTQTPEAWKQFLQAHHESEKNIIQARQIILLFQTSEGVLDAKRKQQLWNNLYKYNAESARNYKRISLKKFASAAASILFILSMVGLLYQHLYQNKIQYQFSNSEHDLKTENSILVLSNGQKIDLKNGDSKIAVLKGQDVIQINNDSIVENQASIDKNTNQAKLNEVIIPFGKKSKLILEDGTKVWLNAGSRFAFPSKFEGKIREVFLDGEAYFEVVKNEKQPFVVTTDNIGIEVLGTKFNVSAYNSDDFCETVLTEGRVNLSVKNKLLSDNVLMSQNQKMSYNKSTKGIVLISEPDAAMYIAWVEGWYPFKNENIEHVLNKIGRFYNVSFAYDKTMIYGLLPVSGKLDLKDSLEEVLEILSRVVKFKYDISGNRVIIVK